MRIAVMVLNLVAFLFTSLILMGDGPLNPGADTIFAALSLLNRVFSILMILLTKDGGQWLGFYGRAKALLELKSINRSALMINVMVTLTMVCNIVVFGFVCLHLAEQYNHPEESGVIVQAVFMMLIPIINVLVLSRSVRKNSP
jgi:hypothetical protein